MSNTPEYNLLDGSGTTPNLTLVTTIRDQVLTGIVTADAVDMQVRINDEPFRSDPNLITFGSGEFTVPNLNVHPEGLRLRRGLNSIEVRAIKATGEITGAVSASIEVVREDDLDVVAPSPSGLRIRRQRDAVELVWAASDLGNVLGYNVYASVDSGGGNQGYMRVNDQLITEVAFQEENLRSVTTDVTFYQGAGGQLRVLLVEEDFNDQPIKSVGEFVMDTGLQSTAELKTTVRLEEVLTSSFHHFLHNRDATPAEGVINNEFFADVPGDEPLYYVITTVAYDPQTNQQVESAYSSELVGVPFHIVTDLQEVPTRSQTDITRDYISSIIRGSSNEISAIPGSVVRDIFVEPFASEAERLHFIANFIRRSQSFATLLEIDDLQRTGESDPVGENAYKQALKAALGFETDADVQALIDDSFEKLASNYQKVRGGAEYAIGSATFYMTTEPTEDMAVETGTLISTDGQDGPSVTFQTTSRVELPFDFRDSYYNVQQRRWEIQANIRATRAGGDGNVAAGQIANMLGGASGFQVENREATRFGRDLESNARLAERSMLALSSVDAGTAGGYLSTALEQQGVFRAKVIKAGDDLMMRDYDDLREKHIGGKVDVWLQGSEQIQVTDTFALRFRVIEGALFTLDSAPGNLVFRTTDSRVTPENPIVEVLGATSDQIAQGFSFRNITTGETFDLTGYEILSYNTIQLDTTIAQPSVGANDLVTGDFRFQETSDYIFSRQPVQGVEGVQSINANVVLEEGVHYELFQAEDPLLSGRSTGAQDYLQIEQEGNGFIAGQTFFVNDERHVLVGETPEPLNNLGVNPLTVRVFSLDRTIEYDGPKAADPDFLVEEGDETTPLRIVRVAGRSIGNGEEVSIDYDHDENFEVEYTINNLLLRVQEAIDGHRHITADVLSKEGISNRVDLEATIVLKPGANRSQVDSEIRTALSQLLNGKAVGEPVYQSDVVQAIENTRGVAFVVVPFAKMALADGSLVVREALNPQSALVEQRGDLRVYALADSLTHPTMDGGGQATQHRGVFQDTQPLNHVSTYERLFFGEGRAMIVGSEGRSIQGYSDDATLTAQGYVTAATRNERRSELTANRIFISLREPDVTSNHSYATTYVVMGDSGARSILPSPVSYLELGDLTITYGEG